MFRRAATIFAAFLVAGSTGGCAVIARSSHPPTPVEGVLGTGGVNSGVALSDDGRYVAFSSIASNLVGGDTFGTLGCCSGCLSVT